MWQRAISSASGGGTANITYSYTGSGQSLSQNIPKSDYVLAIAAGNASSEPCILKPGESETLTVASTTIQVDFSSDGQNISYSKSTAYYYVVIIAISMT